MNSASQFYAFRSPKSIGKPINRDKQLLTRADLTPKKKINIDVSKGNTLLADNGQHPLQQIAPQSQKTISNGNQQPSGNLMQRQFQNIIRNYELKLKNMREEHQKVKGQLQTKVNGLEKQRNQLRLMVNQVKQDGGQKARRLSYEPMAQKRKNQEEGKEILNKLKKDNSCLSIEKEKMQIQVKNLKLQNEKLLNQIKGLNRQISKLHQTEVPDFHRSRSPRPSRHHSHSQHSHNHHHHKNHKQNIPQPPQHPNQIREIEKIRGECQRLKELVSQLNQEKMRNRISQLNTKYGKLCQTQIQFMSRRN